MTRELAAQSRWRVDANYEAVCFIAAIFPNSVDWQMDVWAGSKDRASTVHPRLIPMVAHVVRIADVGLQVIRAYRRDDFSIGHLESIA